VHYHKIGEKVVEQDSTTLNWSTSNADTITIQLLEMSTPLDSEHRGDSEQTSTGRIDQDVTYTLSAATLVAGRPLEPRPCTSSARSILPRR